MHPRWSLITISFIITLFITLSYKFLTNQELMKTLKAEIKELREQSTAHKDDKEKFAEINQKAITKNFQLMKHSMKPTLFTLVPILLLFNWMRETYLPAGNLFSWGFNIPLIGMEFGWLWTYLLSSVIFNIALRKVLKIH